MWSSNEVNTIWDFRISCFCFLFQFEYCFLADLGSGDEKVKKVDVKKFLTPGYSTSGHVELYTVCLYPYWETEIMHIFDAFSSVCVYHVCLFCWLMCFCVFRWVWSEEWHGRMPRMSGLTRTDRMMVFTSRWGLFLNFPLFLYTPLCQFTQLLNLTIFCFISRCGITRKLPSL